MGALYAAHYLWVIFAFQVIAAVLLLVNRYIPLAVAVLAPVIVNILFFHALMAPSGLPLALFVAVLWAVITYQTTYAVDAVTGQLKWRRSHPDSTPGLSNNRGLAYA